jgi:hypothetical protein
VSQFYPQNPSLNSIHPEVETASHVAVLLRLAPVAQHRNLTCQRLVIGDHHPSLAVGAKVFPWVEAETSQIAAASNPTPAVPCAMCLGRVLNHAQTVATSYSKDRLHIRWTTMKMNRHDRLRALGDLRLDLGWIHV